jgi:hypothetical protein
MTTQVMMSSLFIILQSKAIREAGITLTCPACFQGMPNLPAYRIHFENKHPKLPLPPELSADSKSG